MSQGSFVRRSALPGTTEEAPEVFVAGGGRALLNTFQQLMKFRTTLGPYNAVQVMTLAGEGDAARWDKAALDTARELKLGRPMFDRNCSAVTYGPVVWRGVDRTTGTLEARLNAALNRAFAEDELPIRFFLLPLTEGGHSFGAVYDHWIADSRAMRELMCRVYLRYSGKGVAGLPPLTVNAPSMRQVYGRQLGVWPSSTALSVGTRALVRHSRCHRINLTDPVDVSSRLLVRELRPGLIGRVYAVLKQPEATPLAQQVDRIGHETREMKEKGRVARAFSGLTIARTNWILAHNRRSQALNIHKLAPTVAGISNVNMTGSWADGLQAGEAAKDGEVVDYLRTGPAGPVVPLVFTLTTIGQRLHLSMTYRTTAFDDAEARRITEAFSDRLEQVGAP